MLLGISFEYSGTTCWASMIVEIKVQNNADSNFDDPVTFIFIFKYLLFIISPQNNNNEINKQLKFLLLTFPGCCSFVPGNLALALQQYPGCEKLSDQK